MQLGARTIVITPEFGDIQPRPAISVLVPYTWAMAVPQANGVFLQPTMPQIKMFYPTTVDCLKAIARVLESSTNPDSPIIGLGLMQLGYDDFEVVNDAVGRGGRRLRVPDSHAVVLWTMTSGWYAAPRELAAILEAAMQDNIDQDFFDLLSDQIQLIFLTVPYRYEVLRDLYSDVDGTLPSLVRGQRAAADAGAVVFGALSTTSDRGSYWLTPEPILQYDGHDAQGQWKAQWLGMQVPHRAAICGALYPWRLTAAERSMTSAAMRLKACPFWSILSTHGEGRFRDGEKLDTRWPWETQAAEALDPMTMPLHADGDSVRWQLTYLDGASPDDVGALISHLHLKKRRRQ